MPILWRRIAWFVSFAATLTVAWLMRSQGFDWPASLSAATATFIILPFVISQVCAAFVIRHMNQKLPAIEEAASKQAEQLAKLQPDVPRILRVRYTKVIKLAWLQTESEELRSWLEAGWYFLSWFQEGVGQIPINLRGKTPSTIPARQLSAFNNERSRWLDLIISEGEVLTRERDRLKKANSGAPLKK